MGEASEQADECVRCAREKQSRSVRIVKLLSSKDRSDKHMAWHGRSRSCRCCQPHETLRFSSQLLIASHQCHVGSERKENEEREKSSHKYGNFQEEVRCSSAPLFHSPTTLTRALEDSVLGGI